MSDPIKISEPPKELEPGDDMPDIKIGFDSTDPDYLIIEIPIRAWAMDFKFGTALLHGKIREAEAIGMRQMMEIRKRIKGKGLIVPPGVPDNGMTVH